MVSKRPGVFALRAVLDRRVSHRRLSLSFSISRGTRSRYCRRREAVRPTWWIIAATACFSAFVCRRFRIESLTALLPFFPRFLDSRLEWMLSGTGLRFTGLVHLVDEGVDSGPGHSATGRNRHGCDSVDTLSSRIHRLNTCFCKVIELIALWQVILQDPVRAGWMNHRLLGGSLGLRNGLSS